MGLRRRLTTVTTIQAEALRFAAWCLGPGTDTLVGSGLWTRHDAQATQRDVALQLLEEATPCKH